MGLACLVLASVAIISAIFINHVKTSTNYVARLALLDLRALKRSRMLIHNTVTIVIIKNSITEKIYIDLAEG